MTKIPLLLAANPRNCSPPVVFLEYIEGVGDWEIVYEGLKDSVLRVANTPTPRTVQVVIDKPGTEPRISVYAVNSV